MTYTITILSKRTNNCIVASGRSVEEAIGSLIIKRTPWPAGTVFALQSIASDVNAGDDEPSFETDDFIIGMKVEEK